MWASSAVYLGSTLTTFFFRFRNMSHHNIRSLVALKYLLLFSPVRCQMITEMFHSQIMHWCKWSYAGGS